jgi:type II secretory pathway pseudopilin PulG
MSRTATAPRPINRARLTTGSHSRQRRGAVLVVALSCMAIVMAIVGVMLQSALHARRQLRLERQLRQAELLVEAGLDRAAIKLVQDGSYEREVWLVPAEELDTGQIAKNGEGDGKVEIEVIRNDEETDWLVRVVAEYPTGTVASARRTRTFPISR